LHSSGAYLGHHLGAAAGQRAALGLTYRQLEQQAMLLSFIDVFRWTALVAFTCAIVGWLFHKVTHRVDGSVKVHSGH
jgi:hypothetical protein